MTGRRNRWQPPTAVAYRIFLGLWMSLYASGYAVGLQISHEKDLPVSAPAAALVMVPLAASAITVWFTPRLGWALALLGTSTLVWRLLREGAPPPLLWLSLLLFIPVLAGLPVGWAEQRRNG
jgi:hypothetical protein